MSLTNWVTATDNQLGNNLVMNHGEKFLDSPLNDAFKMHKGLKSLTQRAGNTFLLLGCSHVKHPESIEKKNMKLKNQRMPRPLS